MSFEKFSAPLDEEIIEHNLNMLGQPLQALLMTESWGGNTGTVEVGGKHFPCAGANGFAEFDCGKVLVFGNIQDVEPELRSKGHILLRVSGYSFEVVEWHSSEEFTPRAKSNIKESIARYNDSCNPDESPWNGF